MPSDPRAQITSSTRLARTTQTRTTLVHSVPFSSSAEGNFCYLSSHPSLCRAAAADRLQLYKPESPENPGGRMSLSNFEVVGFNGNSVWRYFRR